MKPVGRERDKEIAELKGYTPYLGVRKYKRHRTEKWFMRLNNPEDTQRRFNLPDYSTSWNDAKELWDELSKKKQVNLLISMAIRLTNDNKFNFPDAVSQVWIKWMEGGGIND